MLARLSYPLLKSDFIAFQAAVIIEGFSSFKYYSMLNPISTSVCCALNNYF